MVCIVAGVRQAVAARAPCSRDVVEVISTMLPSSVAKKQIVARRSTALRCALARADQ